MSKLTNLPELTAEQRAEFPARLNKFVADAQAHIDAETARQFPNLVPDLLTIDPGGKSYIRLVKTRRFRDSEGVVRADAGNRSSYCFVEVATGAVLKCESWKKPAKHARGSIFADTFAGYGVGMYGANYR
jgi:hypothetical protein